MQKETEKQIKEMEVWTNVTIGTIALSGLAILTMMGLLVHQSVKSAQMSQKEVLSLNLKFDKALLKNIQTLRQANTDNYLNKALKQTKSQVLNETQTVTERILLDNRAALRYRQINPLDEPNVTYQITAPNGIHLGPSLTLDIHHRTHLKNPCAFEEQLKADIQKNEKALGLPQTIKSANLPSQKYIQFQERTKE